MRRLLIGAVLASASALWPFSSSEKQDPPTPHPDPEGFRRAAMTWKEDHPAPSLDTLIRPTWDTIQHQPGRQP